MKAEIAAISASLWLSVRKSQVSPLPAAGRGAGGEAWSLNQLPAPASVLSPAPQCLGKPAPVRAARQNRKSATPGSPPSPAPHPNPIALLACLGEMVRAVDFQNEYQFHAAEVGRVGRERIFATKLLAADLPVANPLPDGLHEFVGRGALVARTRWLSDLGRGCVS